MQYVCPLRWVRSQMVSSPLGGFRDRLYSIGAEAVRAVHAGSLRFAAGVDAPRRLEVCGSLPPVALAYDRKASAAAASVLSRSIVPVFAQSVSAPPICVRSAP